MRVIYAGSFSPPTLGHLDIIRRAAAMFDEVVVAVLSQSEKTYLFSLEKRREMLARVTDDLANVRVVADTGMLVELARREGADVILRGCHPVVEGSHYRLCSIRDKLLSLPCLGSVAVLLR